MSILDLPLWVILCLWLHRRIYAPRARYMVLILWWSRYNDLIRILENELVILGESWFTKRVQAYRDRLIAERDALPLGQSAVVGFIRKNESKQ